MPKRVPVWTTQGPRWIPAWAARALTQRAQDVPLSTAVRAYLDARALLWVPQKGVLQEQDNAGSVGTTGIGTSITTGAASGTKGTAVELITTTTFDAYWVTVLASNYGRSVAASQGCMDLLLGAATEEILVADMLMGYCGGGAASNFAGCKRWDFPLYVPGGSRLAAQAAGQRTSAALNVAVYLYGGQAVPPFRVGGKVTTYGVTVPNGTTVSPGASGVEGAFAQITASSSADHFALVPSFQLTGDTTTNLRELTVDMGIGAATEEVAGNSYWYHTASDESMEGPTPSMPWFQDIPSGTRLTMRASNSGTNDGGYNGAIHGVS